LDFFEILASSSEFLGELIDGQSEGGLCRVNICTVANLVKTRAARAVTFLGGEAHFPVPNTIASFIQLFGPLVFAIGASNGLFGCQEHPPRNVTVNGIILLLA
jgi:hypothetical protein